MTATPTATSPQQPVHIAKLTWENPVTGLVEELILNEGQQITIGRLPENAISLQEKHISRQHAKISYSDGVFLINDMGSSNGTFVNDVPIKKPYPLLAGDVIRLFVPKLYFLALPDHDFSLSNTQLERSTVIMTGSKAQLLITNGPQEGTSIPLLLNKIRIGRATANAEWEIGLQDLSVSRPHARLEYIGNNWTIYDLGSANGTQINDSPVNEKGRTLKDGDKVTLGNTTAVFRGG